MRPTAFFLSILLAGTVQAAEFGDKRDKPGEVQRLVVPLELIPPTTPRSAEEEMKTFEVAPGFRVELVASDPLVEDPVAMTIGPDGRLWVVEMRGFMANLDGKGEEEPIGRVVVLEDTDGDGKMDKRTIFQDGLVLPRAILLVGDGALIGAPPHLWYCRDKDGDGKADEKIELASNFGTVNNPLRPELGNPEQEPNSPLWAVDNWIYFAHFTTKFRFDGGKWSTGLTTFRGQWGLTTDEDGHFFYNSNQDPLRVDILPSQYVGRNPSNPQSAGVNVQVHKDQLVWPIRVNPGVNRGYRDGILRDNYRLKEFTAACAPCIYRGGLFPAEFNGNAFICEPAGNLVKREIMTAENGSLSCKEAYHEKEFLASTDERFRPVNLYVGPEGALYVVDFYRGVLQHRESFTSYLRKYIEDRGLHQPQHLGRIYRLVPEGNGPHEKPKLHQDTSAQLVHHLASANSWQRETAQRMLVERRDGSTVPALKEMAVSGQNWQGRLHALWTLDGLNGLDAATAMAGLKDQDPKVRAAAIRVSEGLLKQKEREQVLAVLIGMASEEAPFTQQQLVLSLGEAVDPKADIAIADVVKHAPNTKFIQDAAISSLAGRELTVLEALAKEELDTNMRQFVSALARCVFASRHSEKVDRLLGIAVSSPYRDAVIEGISQTSSITAKKPVKFKSEPAVLAILDEATRKKVTALLMWPGKPGAKPEPPVVPLTVAQQARFEMGKTLFTGVCAACHQPHGMGLEGVAPPLVDSEWVLGSEQRIVRIVLHGLTGPISVKGRSYRLDMPPLGVFTDEQVASILTYIRREWEHTAAPVEPETVQAIRAATSDQHESWLPENLLKIK